MNLIIEAKRREVQDLKSHFRLDRFAPRRKESLFLEALNRHPGEIALIAEVKKASPAKGVLRSDFDPVWLARVYESSGAAAISVLTDSQFFMGSREHLMQVKEAVTLPVLRKDFIIDPVQILETAAMGADAVLLIAAVLEYPLLLELVEKAQGMGIEPLVEVHNRSELTLVLDTPARIIGVNNRNLKDFSVDIGISLEMAGYIPEQIIKVSESGIRSRKDICRLQEAGYKAVLVGEALVTAEDPEAAVESLLRGGLEE